MLKAAAEVPKTYFTDSERDELNYDSRGGIYSLPQSRQHQQLVAGFLIPRSSVSTWIVFKHYQMCMSIDLHTSTQYTQSLWIHYGYVMICVCES